MAAGGFRPRGGRAELVEALAVVGEADQFTSATVRTLAEATHSESVRQLVGAPSGHPF